MNTYHAASWSDPYSSSDEEEEICRDVYQEKQKCCKNQHFLDSADLDGSQHNYIELWMV